MNRRQFVKKSTLALSTLSLINPINLFKTSKANTEKLSQSDKKYNLVFSDGCVFHENIEPNISTQSYHGTHKLVGLFVTENLDKLLSEVKFNINKNCQHHSKKLETLYLQYNGKQIYYGGWKLSQLTYNDEVAIYSYVPEHDYYEYDSAQILRYTKILPRPI